MTLGKIVSDERRCFEYLLQELPAHSCSFCQSRDNYLTSRQRVSCTYCRKDIQPLAGTKYSLLNIPCSTWLILLKLFELSISAWKAAEEAGLSYKTTLKGYDILRHAITEELAKSDDLQKGEVESDEAYIGGRRKGKREHSTGAFLSDSGRSASSVEESL